MTQDTPSHPRQITPPHLPPPPPHQTVTYIAQQPHIHELIRINYHIVLETKVFVLLICLLGKIKC